MYEKIAITNRHLVQEDFLTRIEYLCQSDVSAIILREKDLSPLAYKQLAVEVLSICQRYEKPCMLHTFVEVAIELQWKHIHVPLFVLEEKSTLLQEYFTTIGVSTHSLEEVQLAESLGAIYVTYSHIFPTDCKKDLPPRGLEALSKICKQTTLPVYALGGITDANTPLVLATGVSGICQMSTAMQSPIY